MLATLEVVLDVENSLSTQKTNHILNMETSEEFYDEAHRPSHYLNFASQEEVAPGEGGDREDHFT